jgi:serine/threonine protein kinase
VIGKTLVHYGITGLLGKGGMGEVYRAHDTRLDRDVALKVLPAEVAADPALLKRFQRSVTEAISSRSVFSVGEQRDTGRSADNTGVMLSILRDNGLRP